MLNEIKPGQNLCDAFCGVGPLAVRVAKKEAIRLKNKFNSIINDKNKNVDDIKIDDYKPNSVVLANDLNPDCYYYLIKNVKSNKINQTLTHYNKTTDKSSKIEIPTTNIHCFNMDAREFIRSCIEQLKSYKKEECNFDDKFPQEPVRVDVIYMNLPKDALEFLDVFYGLFNGCKPEYYSKEKNNLPIVYVYCFANELNAEEDIINRIRTSLNYDKFSKSDIINIHIIKDISPKKYMYCVTFRIPIEVGFALK